MFLLFGVVYPPVAEECYGVSYICRLALREEGFTFEWLYSCFGIYPLLFEQTPSVGICKAAFWGFQ